MSRIRQSKEQSPEERMLNVLNNLKPRDQLHAGIKFLKLVLKRHGVEGLLEFTNKAAETLDKEGKLLDYDFEGHEDLLKKARPDYASRRTFLRTGAWIGSGLVFGVGGVAQTADQIAGYAGLSEPDKEEKKVSRRNIFDGVSKLVHNHFIGPTDIVIGAALVNEGVEKSLEIKLEQISNAVAEFAETQAKSNESSSRKSR